LTGVSFSKKHSNSQEVLMSDDLIGQLIAGRYVLETLVGEGSMGRVFSGRTTDTNEKVAVKILHQHLQNRQDFRERFGLEAQALSRLANPSFSKIHDSGHDEELDLYFMVLEFIDGANAAKRMESPVSIEEACVIALQVSEALLEAHSQGVLHRDLKPENIMVSNDDPPVVKLLDLGLAKLFDTDPDESTDVLKRRRNLTKAGEVFGTPAYMSPEMCLGNRDISASSDLYSLGLILFEMVEGKRHRLR
jgi:serine/threonine protein kinase